MADMLVKYDKSVHPVGEAVLVYCIKLVSTYEGRSSDPLGILRELLEEKAFRLSDSSNLCQLFIKKSWSLFRMKLVERKYQWCLMVPLMFVRQLAVVLWFVDDQWQIKQRLVRLMLLAKSLTGEEVASQLILILSTES